MKSKMVKILSYRAGQWDNNQTDIISEQAVSLTINNDTWLTFMCTPNDLKALAVGFLFNEGIIDSLEDIANVRVCPGENNIDVWLNRAAKKPDAWIRTSGCSGGETSAGKINLPQERIKPHNGSMLTPERVGYLIEQLRIAQDLYFRTGGVHSSALCNGESILLVAEDIGRHNTLDKLAGHCLLEGLCSERRIILTTGRISSEMIQKASRMGATMVVSRTSPSSLSVQMAENLDITLIGYARRHRFTIYSHPERIFTIPEDEKTRVRSNDQ